MLAARVSAVPERPAAWWRRALTATLCILPICLVWNGRYYDIVAYFAWHQALWHGAVFYRDVAFEYPPLALLPIALPGPLVVTLPAYAAAFRIAMWGCDLWQQYLLWRALPRARRLLGCAAHAAVAACLYTTYLKRFDVAVASCVLFVVVRLQRRPASLLAWAMWAAAVATKLYPALLAPCLLAHAHARGVSLRRIALQLACGATTLVGLFAATYAWAGKASWSWLGYHHARGLHIASSYVAAMAAWRGLGCRFTRVFSYGAQHVDEPWADACATASGAVLVVAVLATALAMARAAPRAPAAAAARLARSCCAVLAAALCTSKVFSPQFAAWLVALGVLAALGGRRRDGVLLLLLGVIAAFTGELFPGEGGIANAHAQRQMALIARAAATLTLWAYLLATPDGPGRRRVRATA